MYIETGWCNLHTCTNLITRLRISCVDIERQIQLIQAQRRTNDEDSSNTTSNGTVPDKVLYRVLSPPCAWSDQQCCVVIPQIGFMSTGHFDADIYGGSGGRYDGYVTSIGTGDMDEVSAS